MTSSTPARPRGSCAICCPKPISPRSTPSRWGARFAAAADAGFTAIEALVPYELPADVIARELSRHKLTPVLFNTPTGNREAGDRGLAAPPGRFDEFKGCIELALSYAKACSVKRLHVVAGI